MVDSVLLQKQCRELLDAYKEGLLGYSVMPEDTNPGFKDNEKEKSLAYFTFPMSLNYQRDSYKLWKAAKYTYLDNLTSDVFSVEKVTKMSNEELQKKLLKYKVALQPNKHIQTWKTLSLTIGNKWETLTKMFESVDFDFLKLKKLIQKDLKRDFPYLSGPKIFNYWSFIMIEYGKVPLRNTEYIDIAPDTHITKCSVILNVITQKEAEVLTKEEISKRWRDVLDNSGILPIQMHPPLWFWSRNNFQYKLRSL
ncbi:hypothetical protein GYA37_04110 [candidate division WWE3 bacterium]|uniref:Uncharacterized protein n=1 Tax=candidate division WWE3 bacterium TaxID=2053526 RepID=A0A7X9E7M1_UNCKA|nr:hypothetical protein [candidate division WWE3 bacterium]